MQNSMLLAMIKAKKEPDDVKIYYDNKGLEINGVNGSIDDWREILLPLLCINKS